MTQNILYSEFLPIHKSYSENIKELIDLCLKKDANLRPSITEIYELQIVKEKFEEFKLYDIPEQYSTPKVSPEKFENNNANMKKLEIIELEIDYSTNLKKTSQTSSKSKLQPKQQVNDTNNLQQQNKMFPKVK